MCGIFGYAAKTTESTVNLPLLTRLAVDTESRGPHSFGFAWIDSRNRLKMFKSTGRISRNIDCLQMAMDAKLLIGHCRYATHGEIDNLNAHPHPCDGGWVVHNGVIRHHTVINDIYGLNPVTDCDSETIGMLIEELDGPLVDRVAQTIEEVAKRNFAMMGLWKSSPNRMIVSRAGNPLHFANRASGMYFASYKHELGKHARSVKNGSLKCLYHRNCQLVVQSQQVIEMKKPKVTPPSRVTQLGLPYDRFGNSFGVH